MERVLGQMCDRQKEREKKKKRFLLSCLFGFRPPRFLRFWSMDEKEECKVNSSARDGLGVLARDETRRRVLGGGATRKGRRGAACLPASCLVNKTDLSRQGCQSGIIGRVGLDR